MRRADYEVIEAVSAAEALKLTQKQQPGIALLDVSMPGIDLSKHLRQEGEVPFPPLPAVPHRAGLLPADEEEHANQR